jgi:hypothetical protein
VVISLNHSSSGLVVFGLARALQEKIDMHSESEQKQEKEKEDQVMSIFEQYRELQRQLLSKQEEQEKVIATLTAEKLRELQRQLLPKTQEEQESLPVVIEEYNQLISLLSSEPRSAELLQNQVEGQLSAAAKSIYKIKQVIIFIRLGILSAITIIILTYSLSFKVYIGISVCWFIYCCFEFLEFRKQRKVITSVITKAL